MRADRRKRVIATLVGGAMAVAAVVTAGPASAADAGPSPASLVVGVDRLPSGQGAAGGMDLTSLGGIDWVHVGADGIDRKAAVTPSISVKNLHADAAVTTLTDSPLAFSWSDGTRTPSATGVTTGGVYNYDFTTIGDTSAYDAGWQVGVPAADDDRQLVLVGGIWQATASLTVTTTDGATAYSSEIHAGGTATVRRLTVTIPAGEGAVVTSTLQQKEQPGGNVSFSAAALRSLDTGLTLAPSTPPRSLDLTAEGTLDWVHLDGSQVDRSQDGDGALAVTNRDTGGSIAQQGDNPVSYTWSNGTPTASQPGTTTGGVFLVRGSDYSQPWGWDLTVVADSRPRTLKFVTGIWQASATISVYVDGSSAASATDTMSAGGGATSALYTVTLPAGESARVSAQITNTTNSNGNVTLAAATLASADRREAITSLLTTIGATDVVNADEQVLDQLDQQVAVATSALAGSSTSAAELEHAYLFLQAAFDAAQRSAGDAQYTFDTSPGLTSSFGWEGDADAPIAFIDGSYRLRDRDNATITFGVPQIPGKISWSNAEGYLPAFVSTYSKRGIDYTVESFSDKVTVGGNDYEVAYSRMTVTNTTSTDFPLPRVSDLLVPLDDTAANATVAHAGQTVVRDYATGADRFGNTYAWPTDPQLQDLGTFDAHYDHMRDYWNDRLAKVLDITSLPDDRLIDAYKAGFIYTLIIRDDVDGQKQLHVGENGYDEMFDHDTIGIVSNLLTLGDFTYAKDYLSTLPAQLQYQDAKWKYSVPFALYLERTGDKAFVQQEFDTIKTNTHTIESDREDDGTGIMKVTNAIDSDGHWTVDNWSALYGLSTYKYVAEQLGDTTEAAWAQSEYDSLLAAANAKLQATMTADDLDYIPMAMDQSNDAGPRSNPHDANWASMFLFGGWAWGSYLYGMPQSGPMLDDIDDTYTHGIENRAGISDSEYNFGGYPHGYYSSAYNAGYGGGALRGEDYRDIGIKAYEFMIDHSQSGPFGWWEGVDFPNDASPWDVDHAAGGGGSDQHMWGQAMGTNVLVDSLISLKSDGSVVVGRGVPSSWVTDGKKVALDRFAVSDGGRIGYSMTTKGKDVTLAFSGDLDKVPSVSVELMALRDDVASVDVHGATVDEAAGVVTLPKGTTSVTIHLAHVPTLAGLLDEASSLSAVEYTSASWATLTTAVVAGKAVRDDASATDADVSAAVAALLRALDALRPSPVPTHTLTSSRAPSGGWYRSDVFVTLATTQTGAQIQYQVDGGAWKTYTKAFVVSAQGRHTVRDRLAAGSAVVSRSAGSFTFGIDTKAPTVSITKKPSSAKGTPRNPVSVAFHAKDATSGVRTISYRVDGGSWKTIAAGRAVTVRSVGSHVVRYRVSDVAGNVSATKHVTVRIAHDAATTVKVTRAKVAAGARETFTLTGFHRNTKVKLVLSGTRLGSVTTDVNGAARVTLTIPRGASVGRHAVTATEPGGSLVAIARLTVTR